METEPVTPRGAQGPPGGTAEPAEGTPAPAEGRPGPVEETPPPFEPDPEIVTVLERGRRDEARLRAAVERRAGS
jgi:hypothetical protein